MLEGLRTAAVNTALNALNVTPCLAYLVFVLPFVNAFPRI